MHKMTSTSNQLPPPPLPPTQALNPTALAASSSKLNAQQNITNSLFIRKEIQRFESVHPNIYSIYDLIDSIGDFNLQQQIREHIVNIEDSFVNSQEWTLSRSVPDLKLGIVGAVNSGKSSLVHRFLTGTYMHEESPEGGRFKKEVVLDGQPYLLLIRDEGGPPEMQFTHWCDAVVFVFSVESEESFLMAHQFFLKMLNFRNMNDMPVLLIGTQDAVSETSPRVIDEARARSLAYELKKCSYFETCATFGLNVERVFLDVCQKVVSMRTQLLFSINNLSGSNQRPATPQQLANSAGTTTTSSSIRLLAGSHMNGSSGTSGVGKDQAPATSSLSGLVQASSQSLNGNNNNPAVSVTSPNGSTSGAVSSLAYYLANPHLVNTALSHGAPSSANLPQQQSNNIFKEPFSLPPNNLQSASHVDKKTNLPVVETNNPNQIVITPCSTPNQKRKDTNRRRSNLFTPNKKEDKQNKINDMGVGRSIPVKQGFLYKKTNSTINKDWKKKFVTLNDDGSLRYYPSMNDYMDEVHGKEIDLQKTTIKIPGANKPRIGKSVLNLEANKLQTEINSLNLNSNGSNGSTNTNGNGHAFGDDNNANLPSIQSANGIGQVASEVNTNLARIDINSKKRHRRVKSNHKSDSNKEDEQEGFEFIIVSLDNKQWHFEAASFDEREEWVQAIEQQILSSLQTNETNKLKTKNGGFTADNSTILAMKNVPGNTFCADCDASNPVWASLNHGELICIECSGIHRNLGTHLSRVRSLELDDWSNEFVQVMTSIGNRMINSIYEANSKNFPKPKPNANSSREDKERWIRAKYEMKLFLAALPNKEIPLGKQLMESVSRQDIASVVLCLAHSKPEDVNWTTGHQDKRTSLHIAASLPNLVLVQLLIWYGADVEATDNQGRTALFYARASNSSDCAQLLVHNGCPDNHANNMDHPISTLGRKSFSTASTSHILSANAPFYDKITFNAV